MNKVLITAGCSFSDTRFGSVTWPTHLNSKLNYIHYSLGKSSFGNGIISRTALFYILELMKIHGPENLLVGIMWSGPDRYDFYKADAGHLNPSIDGLIENPTTFNNSEKRWVILNHGWENKYAKHYYGTFYDDTAHRIYTYEHILRMQWFLKLHNIKYFMATYTENVLNSDLLNPDIRYLHQEIDFDNFVPAKGEYEWCLANTDIPFKENDNHPSPEQHKMFTDQVIIPHLQAKGYI